MLQADVRAARTRHAEVLRELHHDRTNYRMMKQGLEPLARRAFSPLKRVIDAAAKVELSAKPVTDLGRQQIRALSKAFQSGQAKRERATPTPTPVHTALGRAPGKSGEKTTRASLPQQSPEKSNPKQKSARQIEQAASRKPPQSQPKNRTNRESESAALKSVRQAYKDAQDKVSVERVKTAQERLEKLRKEQQQKPSLQVRRSGREIVSSQDRLPRLREGQIRKPRGPELDR